MYIFVYFVQPFAHDQNANPVFCNQHRSIKYLMSSCCVPLMLKRTNISVDHIWLKLIIFHILCLLFPVWTSPRFSLSEMQLNLKRNDRTYNRRDMVTWTYYQLQYCNTFSYHHKWIHGILQMQLDFLIKFNQWMFWKLRNCWFSQYLTL